MRAERTSSGFQNQRGARNEEEPQCSPQQASRILFDFALRTTTTTTTHLGQSCPVAWLHTLLFFLPLGWKAPWAGTSRTHRPKQEPQQRSWSPFHGCCVLLLLGVLHAPTHAHAHAPRPPSSLLARRLSCLRRGSPVVPAAGVASCCGPLILLLLFLPLTHTTHRHPPTHPPAYSTGPTPAA